MVSDVGIKEPLVPCLHNTVVIQDLKAGLIQYLGLTQFISRYMAVHVQSDVLFYLTNKEA